MEHFKGPIPRQLGEEMSQKGQRNVGLQHLQWVSHSFSVSTAGDWWRAGHTRAGSTQRLGTKYVRVRHLWSCSQAILDGTLCPLHTWLRFLIGNRKTGLGCFEVCAGWGSGSFGHRVWHGLLVNEHSTHWVCVAPAPRKKTVSHSVDGFVMCLFIDCIKQLGFG